MVIQNTGLNGSWQWHRKQIQITGDTLEKKTTFHFSNQQIQGGSGKAAKVVGTVQPFQQLFYFVAVQHITKGIITVRFWIDKLMSFDLCISALIHSSRIVSHVSTHILEDLCAYGMYNLDHSCHIGRL